MAQGEVVLTAVAAWAVPVGVLYGIGFLIARRRRERARAGAEAGEAGLLGGEIPALTSGRA